MKIKLTKKEKCFTYRKRVAKRKRKGRDGTEPKLSDVSFLTFKNDALEGVSFFRKKRVIRTLGIISNFLERSGMSNSSNMIENYVYLIEHRAYHRGKTDACKFAKSLSGIAQRYVVSHTFDNIPFTKSDKDGFPTCLNFIKPHLKGSLSDRRNALVVLQCYKLISSHNDEISYDSITKPSPVETDYSSKSEVGDYLKKACKIAEINPKLTNRIISAFKYVLEREFPSSNLEKRRQRLLSLSGIHISGRNGPSGPALASVPFDYQSLKDDRNGFLLDKLREISIITDNQRLKEIMDSFENGIEWISKPSQEICNCRLSLKQETGGKNRLFAIGDFFTQSAFKGMHDYLFQWLSNQPEDGTSDHNVVAQISKEWTTLEEFSYNVPHSVDLSTATDRLPASFQAEIVGYIFGRDISEIWHSLMTDRFFQRHDKEGFVKYKVGQPMGFLSSWAMLALTHHIILKTLQRILKIKRRSTRDRMTAFLIIGDDVAIRGNKLYKLYIQFMTEILYVPTSTSKGFTPETFVKGMNPLGDQPMVSVEIAKRVFMDGQEVTPISPVSIQMGTELPQDLPDLLFELQRREYIVDASLAHSLALRSFKPKLAVLCSSSPISTAPGFTPGVVRWELFEPHLRPPWSSTDWTESSSEDLEQTVKEMVRERLNTELSDTYRIVNQFMGNATIEVDESSSRKFAVTKYESKSIKTLLTNVYKESMDRINKWMVEGNSQSFWVSYERSSQEFKRYLGRMHVIFEIKDALLGKSKFRDEKRFSSGFLLEILKEVGIES